MLFETGLEPMSGPYQGVTCIATQLDWQTQNLRGEGMNVGMKWLATAAVTVSLLFSCRDAAAADAPAGGAAAADPAVWGVYSKLPGTEWSGSDGNAKWHWGPDGTIVESRTFQMKSVIRPGANRGELVSVYGGGLHTYDGRIAPNGSVLWIRRGRFLKMPSRVLIVDGRFVEEMVKLDDASQVAKVNSVRRFEQTAGPTLLAAVATVVPVSGELVTQDAVQPSKQNYPAPAPTLPAEVVPPAVVTLDDPAESAVDLENPASLPPSRELFGPYAELVGRSHITPDGYQIRWFQSSDTAIVHEIRGPDGSLTLLQIIKTTSPGSLVMLRSAGCPDGVCGQTGVVVDGIAHWKEPKASGGYSGEFMDTKVWVEDGQYVSHMTNPNPASGRAYYDQNPHLHPVPQRLSLVQSPALTPAQMEERRAQVSRMEPLVEGEVVKAIGKQLATGQSIADARAARQRSAERVRSFNRTMQGIGGVLNDAVAEVGTYQQAQEHMNATVANIQAQATAERQVQAPAQQVAQPRVVAHETQVAEPVTQPQPGEATAVEPAAAATGKPLRFVMSISLRNQPGDKVNPTCYSNIVSRPGPPGWGAPGFLPPGSAEQARETVYGLKSVFIAQCRASGREITSDGNFNFQMNQMRGDEERLQEMRARYSEDVSVSL